MSRLEARNAFGCTGLETPPLVFGTSCLGNLYQELPWETKLGIAREWFACVAAPVVLDCAGKYGAGLALESIGKALRELSVPAEDVIISNKLAWVRAPLRTPEPTFEPGIWANLKHDAVQKISGPGIVECYEQGLELLGGDYETQLVSVHDPDEYLAAAENEDDRRQRLEAIIDAYQSLAQLKARGRVRAIGVGAKDWTSIRELAEHVELDWVMLALSMTVYRHPPELIAFMRELTERGIAIINTALFQAGFLTGGEFFDYRKLSPDSEEDAPLFRWRERFHAVCRRFDVRPADACVEFGLSAPGVVAVALNTSKPERVAENVRCVQAKAPREFWLAMKEEGLVSSDYGYVG